MKRRHGHVLKCSCPSYELYLLLMQWKGFKTNAKFDGAIPCLLFTCYFNPGDSGSCRVGLVLESMESSHGCGIGDFQHFSPALWY